MQSTLFTIAKDVKIQIEFNPAFVESYRLIGYENRLLASEDFDDDTKDAGELGAGHTVTALYEIVPANRKSISVTDDGGDLRYQRSGLTGDAFDSGELMTLSLRYKQPDGDRSSLISQRVMAELPESTSDDFLFSAAVAEFGMILRDSDYMADASLGQVLSMASVSLGEDRFGYRKSFVEMVQQYAQIVGDDVSVVVD
jgi:Ca-activated chloride channel family protein